MKYTLLLIKINLIVMMFTLLTSCNKEEWNENYTPSNYGCSSYCGEVVDREIGYVYINGNFQTLYYIYIQKDNCNYVHQIQVESTDYFINQIGMRYCNWNQITI